MEAGNMEWPGNSAGDLSGMLKTWPFKRLERWPPTEGSPAGHGSLESPGKRMEFHGSLELMEPWTMELMEPLHGTHGTKASSYQLGVSGFCPWYFERSVVFWGKWRLTTRDFIWIIPNCGNLSILQYAATFQRSVYGIWFYIVFLLLEFQGFRVLDF